MLMHVWQQFWSYLKPHCAEFVTCIRTNDDTIKLNLKNIYYEKHYNRIVSTMSKKEGPSYGPTIRRQTYRNVKAIVCNLLIKVSLTSILIAFKMQTSVYIYIWINISFLKFKIWNILKMGRLTQINLKFLWRHTKCIKYVLNNLRAKLRF